MKTLHTNYKVGAGPLDISVLVGNGHRANTLVALADTILINGPVVNMVPVPAPFVGKTLTVITTVSQTNPQSQDAPVTYAIRGGAQPGDYALDDDFADGVTQVQFTATFDLVGP